MWQTIKGQWRYLIILAFLLVLFLVLVVRMMMIQVIDVDGGLTFLQGQGEARTLRKEVIPANRGMITDRYGKPLAVSTPVVTIWANPKKLNMNANEIASLASMLDLSADKLSKKLEHYKNKQFVYLKRKVSPALSEQVLALDFDGVYAAYVLLLCIMYCLCCCCC